LNDSHPCIQNGGCFGAVTRAWQPASSSILACVDQLNKPQNSPSIALGHGVFVIQNLK
jgi:hypothetical protein